MTRTLVACFALSILAAVSWAGGADFDADGYTTGADLAFFATQLRSAAAGGAWDDRCDLNADHALDRHDAELMLDAFVAREPTPAELEDLLDRMEVAACHLFVDNLNPTTGLMPDRLSTPARSSVAATGFALGAIPIAVKRGVLSSADAVTMADRCLTTLMSVPQGGGSSTSGKNGFFFHFLNSATGTRDGTSEVSSIDTAILAIGALTCGAYLGDKPGGAHVKTLADQLYRRIDWPWMLDSTTSPGAQFRMAWLPGDSWAGHWDYYTDEALLIDLLAVGSPTHPVDASCAWGWQRVSGSYNGHTVAKSWFGSMFSYFFASLWVDLRGRTDRHPTFPVNWWDNAKAAALADRDYCASRDLPSYRGGRFGLSACLRSGGNPLGDYEGDYGGPPTGRPEGAIDDGTLAPYGAAMALPVFATGSAQGVADNPSLKALWSFWRDCPKLWGPYGFYDGARLTGDGATDWYAGDYVGVCQGPLLLGLEEYRSGLIWQTTDGVPYLRAARDTLFNSP